MFAGVQRFMKDIHQVFDGYHVTEFGIALAQTTMIYLLNLFESAVLQESVSA